jgi:ubiquinone/menaquinone biosynthesis C-methylase UbiE
VKVDPGNVLGNNEAKYAHPNPIARWLVGGFQRAVGELYLQTCPESVLDVGCGEGLLADHLIRLRRPARFEGVDVELDRLAPGLHPDLKFKAASVYQLPYPDRSVDLVVCCEVLEHLHDPAAGLAELVRVARRHVLISTPWEPVWRLLNLARGRYVRDLGNTPGHVQHFSRRALLRLAATRLRVTAVRRPLPWTVILGEPRA